ncbi:hypothetical protein N7468_005799 [Penicillium chermesinum]|uniref:Uncharacterized protein n=1 Tax=Penicillium chermesinum TaxID=63820 RepID=A0A9W9P2J3_9EURO|nr:uncharacterized protein N7468_005799 [Penicillium chermesinum]KAJ5232843.1 hypothetical protein N7468_005799 [Penicillium chermesinum]
MRLVESPKESLGDGPSTKAATPSMNAFPWVKSFPGAIMISMSAWPAKIARVGLSSKSPQRTRFNSISDSDSFETKAAPQFALNSGTA